jgi:WD40 repeat protein
LTFSPDGALLASVALSDGDQVDHSAKIWRTSDGALLRTLPDVGEQTTQRLAFSPDGAMVVVGEADHRAHLVRIADGVEVASVGSTTSGWSVLGVAMSPDGTLITANCRCSSPAFHAVRLWRLDGTEDLGVGDLGQIASGFAFSPDGAALAVAVAASPTDATTIKILRLSDRSQVWQANLTSSSPVAGVSLAFSPDGSTIAAAPLFGDNVTVFRASDGQVLRARAVRVGRVQQNHRSDWLLGRRIAPRRGHVRGSAHVPHHRLVRRRRARAKQHLHRRRPLADRLPRRRRRPKRRHLPVVQPRPVARRASR